jgi:hypothetical protein
MLSRGQDAAGQQQVFQARQQLLWTGLVSAGQEVLGQAFADRIRLAGGGSLGGVALGLFLLQVAPVAAFALATGVHAVGTGRRIGPVFEAINKVIEGGGGRRVAGLEARDVGQARMPPEVVGPLGQAFVVE